MSKRAIWYIFLTIVNFIVIVLPLLFIEWGKSDTGLGFLLVVVYVWIPLLILNSIIYTVTETLHQLNKTEVNFKIAKIFSVASILVGMAGLYLGTLTLASRYAQSRVLGLNTGSRNIVDWITAITGSWKNVATLITFLLGLLALRLSWKKNIKVRYLLAFMHIGILLSGYIVYSSYSWAMRSVQKLDDAEKYALAVNNLDIKQCDSIANIQEASNCRVEIVTISEDMQLCEALVEKASCRHNIAVKQKNYELCLPLPDNEHVPFSNRYNCLYEVLQDTGDEKICDVIEKNINLTKTVDYYVGKCREFITSLDANKITAGLSVEQIIDKAKSLNNMDICHALTPTERISDCKLMIALQNSVNSCEKIKNSEPQYLKCYEKFGYVYEAQNLKARPDSDADGLNNLLETNIYLTNQNSKDSDGDGTQDKQEVLNGTVTLRTLEPYVYTELDYVFTLKLGQTAVIKDIGIELKILDFPYFGVNLEVKKGDEAKKIKTGAGAVEAFGYKIYMHGSDYKTYTVLSIE